MPEPVTIMHLRASNFVGGPEKQILEHLKLIDKQHFNPALCSFGNEDKKNELLLEGEAIGISSMQLTSQLPFDPRLVIHFRRLLKKHDVKLLVTHGYKSNIIGYLAAKKPSIPVVVYSHGWTGENTKVAFYEFLDRQIMKLINNIVAVSDGHKHQLIDAGIFGDKVTVIHNAVTIPEATSHKSIKSRYSLPENSRVVISAGRLSPEKNFSGLVKAATPILKQYGNVFFLLLGEGSEREALEQQIADAGLVGRFLLPGFTADVQLLLPDADIFVSSSHTEGLPVAVLEGAGAGLPVVATAVGGTPEVVRDGWNGMLVRKGDMTALGQAIMHLLDDPDNSKAMGTKGAALVREQFAFKAQTEKLETLYQDILCR